MFGDYRKLIYSGAESKDGMVDPHRILASNLISVMLSTILFIFSPVYFYTGLHNLGLSALAFGVLSLWTVAFNKFGLTKFSRVWLIIMGNASLLYPIYLYSFDSQLQNFLFCGAVTPFILFTWSEKRSLFFCSTCSLVMYLIAFSLKETFFSGKGIEIPFWMPYLSVSVSFLSVTLIPMIMLHSIEVLNIGREQQIARSLQNSKNRTVAGLASGVAHEINNPLAIIAGQADILGRLLDKHRVDEDRLRKSANAILRSSYRISSIVKSLQILAPNGSGEVINEKFGLNSLCLQAVDLVRAQYESQGIEISFVGEDDAKVYGVKSDIFQVLISLLNNAFEAVKDEENPWIQITVETEDSKVITRVIDNGIGLKKELYEKAMDPFFTTQPVVKSGLGLSMASSIIRDHKGSLKFVESDNTTIEFELEYIGTAA